MEEDLTNSPRLWLRLGLVIVALTIVRQTIGTHPKFYDTIYWPLGLMILAMSVGVIMLVGVFIGRKIRR